MIRRVSVLAGATIAVAGSLALAPIANAQDTPPFTITAVGNPDGADGQVRVTITKPAIPVQCEAFGVPEGQSQNIPYQQRSFMARISADANAEVWEWTYTHVRGGTGTYDVHWLCRDTSQKDERIEWGSLDRVPEERKLDPFLGVYVTQTPEQPPIDRPFDLIGSLTSGSADGGFPGS